MEKKNMRKILNREMHSFNPPSDRVRLNGNINERLYDLKNINLHATKLLAALLRVTNRTRLKYTQTSRIVVGTDRNRS